MHLIHELIKCKFFIHGFNFFLPTNLTNLHEFIALYYNGDLFGRTNHTNARKVLAKRRGILLRSLLELVRFVRPNRSPFNSLGMLRVDSCDSWATKKYRGQKTCGQKNKIRG